MAVKTPFSTELVKNLPLPPLVEKSCICIYQTYVVLRLQCCIGRLIIEVQFSIKCNS